MLAEISYSRLYSCSLSEFGFYEYILQRPSWRFVVYLSKKRLVLYWLPVFHKNVFKARNWWLICPLFLQGHTFSESGCFVIFCYLNKTTSPGDFKLFQEHLSQY